METDDDKVDSIKNLDDFDSNNFSSEIKEAAKQFFKEIINNAPDTLQKNNREMKEFKEIVNELWKDPLDLLELFLILSKEAGAQFNRENRPIASEQNDYVFEALTRLHAKACLIGGEIITLMKNGYASGAHARWRSLHEIGVTALFIKERGNDVAERYLNYRYIEAYYAMKQFKEYATKLHYEPLQEDEERNFINVKNSLIKKYGESFENSYGWASKELNKPRPRFTDIEKAAGIDHMRPYYKMASNAIHADSNGIFFNIGLHKSNEEKILLAGQSYLGFADPASGTALSLNLTNVALLNSRPTVKNLIFLDATSILVEEINETFLSVHKYIEDE